MSFFKKVGQNLQDIHKPLEKIVDPLGVVKTLTGPGVKKPNLTAEELAREQILKELEAGIPKEYIAERYVGDFTPQQIEEISLQRDSQLKGISTDPRYRDAQLAALESLQERADGGYSVEDRAAINKALREAALNERAQRDALLANAQARGAGSGGNLLAQQLMAQQASADRSNQNSLDIAAEGRRRALEAAMMSGQLGTQMQGQDFSQQAQVAAAQDAINQFNTTNLNNQARYNTDILNQAGMNNQSLRQGVASNNAVGRNSFNQNRFNNNATVAQTKYGHVTGNMNRALESYQNQVNARNAKKGAILGAAGTIAGAAYGGAGGAQIGGQLGQNLGGTLADEEKR